MLLLGLLLVLLLLHDRTGRWLVMGVGGQGGEAVVGGIHNVDSRRRGRVICTQRDLGIVGNVILTARVEHTVVAHLVRIEDFNVLIIIMKLRHI